jgi:anti-sigma B factor antagonist
VVVEAKINSPVRQVRQEQQTLVVTLAGDVDLHRTPELQQELARVVDRRPRRIVLDLTGVQYMDSSGVASLVKLLSSTRRLNIELKLCGLVQRVLSIFEITRLDTVFDICPTVQEAMA